MRRAWLAGAGALAGLMLAAVWLVWGPAWVAGRVGDDPGAVGELLFSAGVFTPLLLLGIAGGAATRITAWRPGARPWRALAIGAALGLGGLLAAAGLSMAAGTLIWRQLGPANAVLLLGVITIMWQVGAEELLFRGWLQPLLARAIGLPAALVTIAAAFAALHLLAGAGSGWLTLLNMMGGGLLFGTLAARNGGIAGAIGAHGAWNLGEQLLLGIDPNAGAVGSFGTLFDFDLDGASAWGGSAAGLNASWAMLIALAALVAPLLLRWRAAASHVGSAR